MYAKADSRKPNAGLFSISSPAPPRIIFTLPKDDMLKGATRCIKRIGILRGNDVSTRYRRLDMRCTRTKTDTSIAISRGTDE